MEKVSSFGARHAWRKVGRPPAKSTASTSKTANDGCFVRIQSGIPSKAIIWHIMSKAVYDATPRHNANEAIDTVAIVAQSPYSPVCHAPELNAAAVFIALIRDHVVQVTILGRVLFRMISNMYGIGAANTSNPDKNVSSSRIGLRYHAN